MDELIHIADQTFYYTTVKELTTQSIQYDNCAVIITEEDLKKWMKDSKDVLDGKIHQIIVVSDKLNRIIEPLKNHNLLLIAVGSFGEGINLAMRSKQITKRIICVSSGSLHETMETINLSIL